MNPNPFPRTIEEINAQKEYWEKAENNRRRTDPDGVALRKLYAKQFPYRTDTAIMIRDAAEVRNPHTGLPQFQQDRYDFGKALLIAGAASFAFWGVIYLIIGGGQ